MQKESVVKKPPLKPSGGGTRIGYIDALKGFAILCVVLGHVADGYLNGNTYPEANRSLFCIFNAIYAFHMPLFMMISGYVYAVAYFDAEGRPDSKRIYQQIGNIAVVYVLFSMLFGLAKIALGRYTNHPAALKDILLIWGRPISPYWYLYDMMLLYLLFSIPVLRNVGRRWMICILAAASFFSNYISFYWFEFQGVLHYALFFYIGISGCRYSRSLAGNRQVVLGAFAVSIILCVVFWDKGPYTIREETVALYAIPMVSAFIAVGLSLMLWYLFQHVKWLAGNRFLAMVGRHSLEIYVIHCIFTAGFRAVLPRVGISNAYLSVALNLVLSTSISLMGSIICERIGVYELIFRPVSFWRKRKGRA